MTKEITEFTDSYVCHVNLMQETYMYFIDSLSHSTV